ncbi:MAG TPA: hypothetical protein VFA07_07385 [Chthonomonadaceae bacterium]|nr:hypothetical protein [Chthonomonadaceae bacterium]
MKLPIGKISGAIALLACVAAAQPQATTPLMCYSFEADTGMWMGFGSNAKVSLTHDAAHVREGKGALQFDYTINKGEINALLLPTPNSALAKAKSLRFWVQADHAAPLAVALQEQEGGRYIALFSVPKETWQQVDLSTSDFVLSENPGDPKDPDGKLDLDQVQAVAIVDVGQLFAQAEDPNMAKLFPVKKGPHTLYVDDFTVSEETLPASVSATDSEVKLDSFVHPQPMWIGTGDARLSRSVGKPLDGNGMQADYHQAPSIPTAFVRLVPRGKLADMEKLSFDAASARPAKLIVQVEEQDGGKYNTEVDVDGGSAVKHVSVSLANLKADQNTKDSNDRLDKDLIKQIVILDASGLIDHSDQDNTLWLGNLRATKN